MWSIVGGVFFLFFLVLGIVYYTCRKLINEFQEKKIKQRLGIVDEPVVVEETLPKKKKKKKKDLTKKVSFERGAFLLFCLVFGEVLCIGRKMIYECQEKKINKRVGRVDG